MTKLRRAKFGSSRSFLTRENLKGRRVVVAFKSQSAYDEDDEFSGWGYGYTDDGTGRGQESSPEIFESKKQALEWAKEAKYYDVTE